MGMMRCAAVAAVVGLAAGAYVWAEPGPAGATGATGTTGGGGAGEGSPLSGPSVSQPGKGAAKPTLVERDFEGKVKRLEVPPEEAALEMLGLTAEEREATAAVLAARASLMDRLLVDHYDLVARGLTIRNEPEAAKRLAYAEEVRKAFAPVREQGRLVDLLAAKLPEGKSGELRRMTREYWEAVLREGAGEVKEAGDRRGAVREQMRKLGEEAFGHEIKRSFERLSASGQQRLDDAVKTLGLTPEQELKVRNLSTDFAQQTKLKPTAAQRAELFRKIMAELTPEQRVKAWEMVRGR
ncbi:MAG: hypothetical protein IBJ11_11925 [Phycisphaerales bacterium]|nr:hypothetical protein [Phycisphaerales bacterium]